MSVTTPLAGDTDLQVGGVHTVDDEAILRPRGTVDRNAAQGVLVGGVGGLGDDRGEVTAARQLVDQLAADRRGRGALGDLDHRRFTGHDDRVGDLGELHGEVDRQDVAQANVDVGDLGRGEAVKRCCELVEARQEPWEPVLAGAVGDGRLAGLEVRRADLDRDTRQGRARRVGDGAVDGGRSFPGPAPPVPEAPAAGQP